LLVQHLTDVRFIRFGMNNIEYTIMTIITISLAIGFIIGFATAFIIKIKECKELEKEMDKFRDLYFNELDKWRDKYTEDDYEAY